MILQQKNDHANALPWQSRSDSANALQSTEFNNYDMKPGANFISKICAKGKNLSIPFAILQDVSAINFISNAPAV